MAVSAAVKRGLTPRIQAARLVQGSADRPPRLAVATTGMTARAHGSGDAVLAGAPLSAMHVVA